jgi:hypothetical protein
MPEMVGSTDAEASLSGRSFFARTKPAANKIPVTKWRSPTGISTARIGLPSPHISTIAPIPTVIMTAIPKNSERYSGQWSRIKAGG